MICDFSFFFVYCFFLSSDYDAMGMCYFYIQKEKKKLFSFWKKENLGNSEPREGMT